MESSTFETAGMLIIILGILFYMLAKPWMIILAFGLGPGPGFGVLFLGWLFYFFMLFKNPRLSKMPLILMATAFALWFLGFSIKEIAERPNYV